MVNKEKTNEIPSFVKEAFTTKGINEILAMCDNEQCDILGFCHSNYKNHDFALKRVDDVYCITTTYNNLGYCWSSNDPTIITVIKSDDIEIYKIKE